MFLCLAILIGAFLRLWKLTSIPFPPSGDELFFGYYGWSLLHFGTDEFGRSFPQNFISIGDFKYPFLAYINMIPAAIFGLSEITTRFWTSISGILLSPLIYMLVNMLFKNQKIAVISAFFIALSPWSIIESRIGYENHLALTLTIGGFVALFAGSKEMGIQSLSDNKRKLLLILSFILFLSATFCYAAMRLFIPAMLVSLAVCAKYFKLLSIKKVLILFFIVLSIIVLISLIPKENRGRAEAVSYKGLSAGNRDRLEQLITGAGVSDITPPIFVTRMFQNKLRVVSTDSLSRYMDHFSPVFLFFKGEPSFEKIPDMGVMLYIDILLIATGVLSIFTIQNKFPGFFLLAWLVLSPVPSSLTEGGAHINRASAMLVPLVVLSAFGFYQLVFRLNHKFKYIFSVVLGSLFLWNSLFALNQIFVQKATDRPWYREQVNKYMIEEVSAVQEKYKAIAISKDEFIYFLFYNKISPAQFLKDSDINPYPGASPWDRVNRLGKIFFNMPSECPKSGKSGVLYVCYGENIPQNAKVLKTFYYKDGIPAIALLEFLPISKMPAKLPPPPDKFHYMVDVETNPKALDGIIPDDYPTLW